MPVGPDEAQPQITQEEVIQWLLGVVATIPAGFEGCIISEGPIGLIINFSNGQVFNIVVGEITPPERKAVEIKIASLKKSDLRSL